MADWLDGWARRAARPKDEPPNASSGLSRRQLLKRAGVVAGAAWTVPLIQTALAPPAAASVVAPCPANCIDGTPCHPKGSTSSTPTCSSGYCGLDGTCWTKPWQGGTCNGDSDCQSGICTNGVCQPGWFNAPCNGVKDCQSGICGSSGLCLAGGASKPCQGATDCLSGSCVNGTCAPSLLGGVCYQNTDCAPSNGNCSSNAGAPATGTCGGLGAVCATGNSPIPCSTGHTCSGPDNPKTCKH